MKKLTEKLIEVFEEQKDSEKIVYVDSKTVERLNKKNLKKYKKDFDYLKDK